MVPFSKGKKNDNVERFCIIINPAAFECVRKTKRTLRSLFCARFGDWILNCNCTKLVKVYRQLGPLTCLRQ